jgi:hypothetical protein
LPIEILLKQNKNPDQPEDSFLALTSVLHQCIEIIRDMAKYVIATINEPAAGADCFLPWLAAYV